MKYDFRSKIEWDRREFPNIPLFSAKLPKYVTNKLWEFIEKAKQNPNSNNSKLAGNISSSLMLTDENNFFMNTVLDGVVYKYLDPHYSGVHWCRDIKSLSHCHKKLVLSSFWANFQKQTEFNPVHDHSGVLSFVIWLKIPTNWTEQHELPISKNSNSPCASDFQFMYTDILGNIATENVTMSKGSENTMVIFPSQVKHLVYPFYNCDSERVSVSGNISIDSTQYSEWKDWN